MHDESLWEYDTGRDYQALWHVCIPVESGGLQRRTHDCTKQSVAGTFTPCQRHVRHEINPSAKIQPTL